MSPTPCLKKNFASSITVARGLLQVACAVDSYNIHHKYTACTLCGSSNGSVGCSGFWNAIHNLCKLISLFQFSRGTENVLSAVYCMYTCSAVQHTARVGKFPLFILRANNKGMRIRDIRVMHVYVQLCFARQVHIIYLCILSFFLLYIFNDAVSSAVYIHKITCDQC
jgi:hypothetical protein